MIASAELAADVGRGEIRHAADEVHGGLTGGDGLAAAGGSLDHSLVDAEKARDLVDDGGGGGNVLVGFAKHIAHGAVGALLVHLLADQVAVGEDLIHRALKLADVAGDVLGDVLGNVVVDDAAPLSRLVFDDGKARFKIGRLDVDEQAPLEAGLKTVVEQLHLLGRAVGGEDDLTLGLVEGVEGMEKLLLCLLAAGDELHVVHQQKVRVAVFAAELDVLAGADGLDQLVGEIVALDVDDLGVWCFGADFVRDGVDQVRLAEAGVTVDEKWVVVLRRRVRDRAGRGVGELVAVAHNEGIEGKFAGLQKRSRLFGLLLPKSVALGGGEELHIEIGGEDLLQCRLEVRQKEGFDRPALEVIGTTEVKGHIADGDRLHLVEPGGDGRFSQTAGAQALKHDLPDVSYRVQRKRSFRGRK